MASDRENAVFTENLPPPPPFWEHFTAQNVENVKALLEEGRPIPSNLRHLIPPLPPSDGKYRSFGEMHDIQQPLTSLESLGQEQLYPNSAPLPKPAEDDESKTESDWTLDRAFYLKKTTRSILLNFLELVGILAQDPSQVDLKLQHITTLFYNAHHMLNEYRPHQAREALILMMEEQLEKKKAEIESVKTMKVKVDALLGTLPTEIDAQTKFEVGAINGFKTNEDSIRQEQEATWAALEEQLGT